MQRRGMRALLGALVLIVLGAPLLAAPAVLPARPLTLEDCLALARAYNPSLDIAHENVVGSQADVQRLVSSYYPTATFSANRGRTGGLSFVETSAGPVAFSASGRRNDSDVVLDQTLWQTGRAASLRGARHALAASRAQGASAEQDLALSVSQLYYDALAAQELVKVSEAALAATRDQARLVQARITVGEVAPVDAASAEAEVAGAELALLEAQSAAALARARLKREMGVPPTYPLQLAERGTPAGDEPPPSLSEAVDTALAERPDLAAARSSVAAGEEALRVARAQRRGLLAVTSQYDRGLTGIQQGASWATLLSVTGFLFDAGARRADVDAAGAEARILQAQRRQAVNAVGLEVESALLDVETARKRTDAARKAVTSAEARLAAAVGKYQAGAGIFIEISDAQKFLTQAQADRVRAVYDHQKALVALRRAMGRLSLPTAEANL